MRDHLRVTLLVFLCLWIPVAQSHEGPEDQDASGDDEELSGSGSGDFNPTDDFELTTEATPNTKITTGIPNVPVGFPEHPVTQSFTTVSPKADPKTELIILAPVVPTTQSPETLLPTTIKSAVPVDLEEDQEIVQTSVVPETTQTIIFPVDKLPVPTTEGEFTTATEGEFTTATEGEFTTATEGEFTTATEGEFTTATEGEFTTATEGEFTTATEGEFTTATEGEFATTSFNEDFEETTLVGQNESEGNVFLYDYYTTDEPEDADPTDAEPKATVGTRVSTDVADPEASGDDVSMTTQTVVEDFLERNSIPDLKTNLQKEVIDDDDDFMIDNDIGSKGRADATLADNENLLERKEILAGVIAGGVVGLAFAVMLVALMVYRMKKKDEGSYSLDDHKHPNGGYQKPQRQEEFLA